MGEPSGIGGEIALMAWRDGHNAAVDGALPPFFVIDDAERLAAIAADLFPGVTVRAIDDPSQAPSVFPEALPVLHRPLAVKAAPGRPDGRNAACVTSAIDSAVDLVQSGRAGAVVTNPIHKKSLYDAGFAFPGHTEYLAHLAGISTPPVMMLAGSDLRVVPVSIHVSLQDAIHCLSEDAIVATAAIAAEGLERDFAISSPRLAVAGLNPHAGEGGAMGTEETDLIAPAVVRLRAMGIDAGGPWPPDTLFHDAARRRYDAAICMYHDQALIPIKTLHFDDAVNITLGLPFVRTSPDHGTAFDIAGKGIANPKSLKAALSMAGRMAANRAGR